MEIPVLKFELYSMPHIKDTEINGTKLFIQAMGVKLSYSQFMDDYYFKLDKNYLVAKTTKGDWVNCKIKIIKQ